MNISALLWIGLGGALGSILRALLAMGIRSEFPWATLLANVAGCLLIGLAVGHESATETWSHHARGFVVVGFCGGFTTFSTFGLQTLNLLESGDWAGAVANVFASLVLCLVVVWAGIKMGKLLFQAG